MVEIKPGKLLERTMLDPELIGGCRLTVLSRPYQSREPGSQIGEMKCRVRQEILGQPVDHWLYGAKQREWFVSDMFGWGLASLVEVDR